MVCSFRTRILLCLTLGEEVGTCYKQDMIICLHQNLNLSTLLLNRHLSAVYQTPKHTYWHILFGPRREHFSSTAVRQHKIATQRYYMHSLMHFL